MNVKKFLEYVSDRDGVVQTQNDSEELLKRIVRLHGERFRVLLKNVVRDGLVDDSPELMKDLKELYKSINGSEQHPPTQRYNQQPDIVSRPTADGGGTPLEPN